MVDHIHVDIICQWALRAVYLTRERSIGLAERRLPDHLELGQDVINATVLGTVVHEYDDAFTAAEEGSESGPVRLSGRGGGWDIGESGDAGGLEDGVPNVFHGETFGIGEDEGENLGGICVEPGFDGLKIVCKWG